MKTAIKTVGGILLALALLGADTAVGQEQIVQDRGGPAALNALMTSQAGAEVDTLSQKTADAISAIKRQAELLPNDPIGNGFMDLTLPDTSDFGEFTVETREFYDADRNRTVTVVIHVPVRATIQVPILVVAQGLSSHQDELTPLSKHLTSRGFAVVAITDAVSHSSVPNGLGASIGKERIQPNEFVNRPKDVSFVLDEIDRIDRSSEPFGLELSLEKVGVIGHSFGGYTALALAGAQLDYSTLNSRCKTSSFVAFAVNPSLSLQCEALKAPAQFTVPLKDDRVRAIMAINPIGSSLFGQSGFSQIDVPVLMVAGTDDSVAPALIEQVRPFTWLNHPEKQPKVDVVRGRDALVVSYPQHYLALIEGGDHLYAVPGSDADDAFLRGDLVSASPEIAYDYLKALSLSFFNPEVAEYDGFRRGFTTEALDRLSQPSLPLHVTGALDARMLVGLQRDDEDTRR